MCYTPITLKQKERNDITVPCGKCALCVARRISAWSFRLTQQEKVSDSSSFITLTYDTGKVPITDRGLLTLDKRDLQLFFKSLRKRHNKNNKSIKYYAVGEYGSRTSRPHYHIILFNAKVEHIQPAWDNGEVHYGNVSGASIGYTLKYISKRRIIPISQDDDRKKEFSIMSKKLGANYLTRQMVEWHKNDIENRLYCTTQDGKKIAMPRYYKEKIYTEEEKGLMAYFFEQKLRNTPLKDIRTYHEQEQLKIHNRERMYQSSVKNEKL